MEAKREEFRSYLERSGFIHSLTQALIKLYEAPEKPENAVPFICIAMSGSVSELFRAQNRIHELDREISAIRHSDDIRKTISSQCIHRSEEVADKPRLSQRIHHCETGQREEISDEPCLSQRSHQSDERTKKDETNKQSWGNRST